MHSATRVLLWLHLMACAAPLAGCSARAPVSAFPELHTRVRPGHTVYVIGTDGRETRGQLVALRPHEIEVGGDGQVHRFAVGDIRQVQRYGDSLWNGTLIGLAAFLPGALIADPQYGPCPSAPTRRCATNDMAARVLGVAVGGLAGMGIDALVRHRDPVYIAPGAISRSLRLAPLVTHRGGGVVVSVQF